MRFTLGGDKWIDVAPTKVQGNGRVIFEVDVTGKRPEEFKASFFDNTNQRRWWNNSKLNFGQDIRLALGSKSVHTALAVEAQRRGQKRDGVGRQLSAYAAALFRGAKPVRPNRTRGLSKRQQRLQLKTRSAGVEAVRRMTLRPSKGPRPFKSVNNRNRSRWNLRR
jgi:hypothetical protein